MTDELKPCPLCGATNLDLFEIFGRGHRLECPECGMTSGIKEDGPSLLAHWNTRQPDPTVLVEALEGMIEYAQFNEGWQDAHPEYVERARAALAQWEDKSHDQ